jgi:small redox-active disulfide protein 2
MKKIKILGSGCAKCNQLADAVKKVVAQEGIEATIEKVEDIQQIMAYNVLSTPALVVDEEVRCKGYVPSMDELKELLNAKPQGCCCGGTGQGHSGTATSNCCSTKP